MGPADGEPLLRALADPAPALPLHLPSHGRGRSLAPGLRRLLRLVPGSWDLPELPAIGSPLASSGAVAESQARSAALLGAERAWYGVNGASGLLQVALLALAPPGSRVLLPRNLHRSLLHGCVLGQIEPLLYALPFDPGTGLWLPPDPAHLERVLAAASASGPVAALVLLDPTYQGLVAELPALIALAHGRGLPVLVDQAHGSGAAVAAGADFCVLSLQKNATGLAQSAVLLAQGKRVDPGAIERALLWLQTSSPSALLLAASAAAIDHAHSPAGRRQLERAQRRGLALRTRLESLGLPVVAHGDPLRLVLAMAPLGMSGLAADAWLMERGVIAELPEPGALTFCLGLEPPHGVERQLPRQLLALRQALGGPPLPPFSAPPVPLLASPELPLGQAWRAACVSVPLSEAAGRIAAEPLCPYPPGIPLLVPGERIDRDRALWLERQRQLWPDQLPASLKVVDG